MDLDLVIFISICLFGLWVWAFVKILWMKPGQRSIVRGISAPLMYMLGAILLGLIIELFKLRMS